MKAYNLADKKEYYAQPADEYTKMIMNCAEYYIDHGSHILLLIPDKNVDRGWHIDILKSMEICILPLLRSRMII